MAFFSNRFLSLRFFSSRFFSRPGVSPPPPAGDGTRRNFEAAPVALYFEGALT